MKKLITIIVILLLNIALIASAENQSSNKELLEEIDIMEAVLDKLISKNNEIQFQGSNSRGFYLPDYGVIFNSSYNTGPQNIIGGDVIYTPAPEPTTDSSSSYWFNTVIRNRDGIDKEKKDIIPEIKESLLMFFTKYASSLSGLKPHEKITIVLDLDGFKSLPSGTKNNLPSQLTVTVSMNDILSFKKDKISIKELEKRVVFNEIESIDEDVAIFSNIIQTSLKHLKEDSGHDFPGRLTNVKSAFIQGDGIIFMANFNVGVKGFSYIYRDFRNAWKELEYVRSEVSTVHENLAKQLNENMKKANKNKKMNKPLVTEFGPVISSNNITDKWDDFEKIEEKLEEIMSKYGHTLSKVKKDEWVEIFLDYSGMGMDNKFSRSIIKVKKCDIDDFNKEKIDFDSFRKKVSVFHY
jgi:uncharacterized protein (UPF0335 family)